MDTTFVDEASSISGGLGGYLGSTTASPMHLPRWDAVALAYLAEVEQRTGSVRTPGEYGRYLARFLAGVDDPAAATPVQVHAFAYGPGPSGRAPSPSTVGVRLAALRGFFDFVRRMRLMDRNPADDVKRPRNADPTPRGLTADELRALLAQTPPTPSGAREAAGRDPALRRLLDRSRGREVGGQHAPGRAGSDDPAQGVEDLAQVMPAVCGASGSSKVRKGATNSPSSSVA